MIPSKHDEWRVVMSNVNITSLISSLAATLLTLAVGSWAQAQPAEPMNGVPNPYRAVEAWAQLPDGRTWGSTAGVDIDPDGEHIWAIDRCGANTCVGSDLDPLLKINQDGEVVASIGGGHVLFPHGLHVDSDGNVWVTDAQGPNGEDPRRDGKGHVVLKFSPEGELLLTLGTPGESGNGENNFDAPCDVVTGPNGDIFVADGHGGQNRQSPPDTTARIVKFSSDGTYITEWGQLGSGPGEFRTPHAIAIDPHGRLVVGDRGNDRLQMFDLDGNFIDQWTQFSRPSGIHFGPDGLIYVADSESNRAANSHWGWEVGIRVGSLEDGSVTALIGGSNPEGVAVDAAGNVYGAVVSYGGNMIRHERLTNTDLHTQKPQD